MRPARVVLFIAWAVLGVYAPHTARADPCATFITCEDDNSKYVMRWPRQSQNWNVDLIPGGAHVVFTHFDAQDMIAIALRRYYRLDPAVPWDQVDLARSGSYARTVHWVAQADLEADPENEEGFPFAWAGSGLSSRPLCWLVTSEVRFAVDPHTGSQSACWMNHDYDPFFCGPIACGNTRLDFLSVAVHEVGHVFGLADNYDSNFDRAAMYNWVAFCDTTKRQLLPCEADTVRRRYHDNPAASLRGFAAYRSGSGVEAVWDLETGERNTRQYHLAHAPDWNTTPQYVAVVPTTGARTYAVEIPGVNDGVIRIYEEELDGTMLSLGADLIGERPPPVVPAVFRAGNIDSMCRAIEAEYARYGMRRAVPEGVGIQNIIFARDSMMAPARWFADWKRDNWGINSVAMSVDSIGGDVMIKPTIQQQLPSGGTVTLLGSAFEDYSVTGEPMRADPDKYRNGLVKDPFPNQPYRDIIRTYFIVDTLPPDASVGSGLPWVTTDAWFVDFTGDLFADEGYGIGRLPAQNVDESWLMIFESARFFNPQQGNVWHLSYAQDWQWNLGVVATSMADSVQAVEIPQFARQYRFEDNPSNPMSGSQRDAAFTTAFNNGGLWVDMSGTVSGGYNTVDFGRVNRGYRISDLQSNPGNLAIVLGWSCYIANHAGTENPVYGHRSSIQLLLDDGGARAVIGATSGTLQMPNQSIGVYWHRNWMAHPEWGLGRLLQATLRDAYQADERDSTVAREYVLLGDPDITVPHPLPPVVGRDDPDAPSVKLYVSPNPAWSDVGLAWVMPQEEHVQLEVFDVSGRKLQTLVDRQLSAGLHTMSWKPISAQPGIYFVGLRVGSEVSRRKVVWLR
ncbi:MAG: T9SS type A sorting domain-containing protein [Candidatus Kerfeldbacteria bacterium]|nr:T9SS type A sorting domain-containing protein [Candidatus Kerfeldbacteria bacterium]